MTSKSITLTATARSAIVSTYINALASAENTGSLLTQVCETANKYTRGESLQEDDMKAITGAISKERGWKGSTATARESEVRVILRASAQLPEAIEGFTARAKKCDWHTGMKLARCINRGDSVKKAVAQVFAKASNPQSQKSNPPGRAAAALKAWYNAAKGDKKTAILKAAELLGLKLGIKVTA